MKKKYLDGPDDGASYWHYLRKKPQCLLLTVKMVIWAAFCYNRLVSVTNTSSFETSEHYTEYRLIKISYLIGGLLSAI